MCKDDNMHIGFYLTKKKQFEISESARTPDANIFEGKIVNDEKKFFTKVLSVNTFLLLFFQLLFQFQVLETKLKTAMIYKRISRVQFLFLA